jgi:hypothetical protein
MATRHASEYRREVLGGPEIKNVGATLFMVDPLRIPFRGRVYEAPPLPFKQGVKLLKIQARIEAMAAREEGAAAQETKLDEYLEVLRDAATLLRRNLRPDRGRLRRMRWRLGVTGNPFIHATEHELAQLVGFLSLSRTSLAISSQAETADREGASESISSNGSASSSENIQPGSDRTGSRFRGGTSATGSVI